MVSELELKARVYYHGTSKRYYDKQIAKHMRYQHDPVNDINQGLFVGLSRDCSEWIARDRSYIGDTPVLLKIKGDSIRGRIRDHKVINDIVVDYLELNEFELIELKRK